jgi:N-acylneuraminate cytidylyltransferase
MSRIAIIPARSGSKGIRNKNLSLLAGVELIQYSIDAALRSSLFEEIILDSDSEEYRRWSKKNGITFHLRRYELGADDASISSVISDILESRITTEEWLYLFQPTNPFVKTEHIQNLIAMEGLKYPCIQTVCEVSHTNHAWNQRIVDDQGVMRFLNFENRQMAQRKQDKPKTYKFGNLVATRISAFKDSLSIWQKESGYSVIAPGYDIDIDFEYDLKFAEALLYSGVVKLDS